MLVEGWFDAACEPTNPGGHIGWGALLKLDGSVVWTGSGYIPASWETSNNYGEYLAMLSLLEEIHRRQQEGLRGRIHIRGDSKLVIMQLKRRWKVHGGLYVPVHREASELLVLVKGLACQDVGLQWIPREQNSECDVLSKAELHKRGIGFKIQPEMKEETK